MKDEFLDRESVAYNRDNVGRIYLVYAPKTQFTTKLMEGAMNNLGITEANKVDNRGINNHFTHGYVSYKIYIGNVTLTSYYVSVKLL